MDWKKISIGIGIFALVMALIVAAVSYTDAQQTKAEFDAQSDEITKLAKTVEDLEKDVFIAENTISTAKQELKEASDSLADKEQTVTDLQTQLEQSNSESQKLVEEIEQVKEELEEAQKVSVIPAESTGDKFSFYTTNDLLEIREPVGDVFDTLTVFELDVLAGGQVSTDEGSTGYSQYLRFGDSSSTELQTFAVNYVEDEKDILGYFLVIEDDKPFFEWEVEFSEGLESSSADNKLEDLENEKLKILGKEYTIVDTSISGNSVTLELMAGDVSDTLREGETKTYTIDGVDYEVTVVFISDPNSGGTPEAKFAVNGELTDGLEDGQTDTLNNGFKIGVRDLLVNSREGVVEFFVGAERIELVDSDVTSAFGGSVEINNENIEDAEVSIVGASIGSGKFEITSIKYRLTADAKVGSTIYVAEGHGVREYLDEPEGMFSEYFDIRFDGTTDVATSEIALKAQSDERYELAITNLRGKVYEFPFVSNEGSVFQYGDEDDRFIFVESTVASPSTMFAVEDFQIKDDYYFVVSEGTTSSNTEKDDSSVLRYEDIDTSERLLSFTDVATGETREVSYTTLAGVGNATGIATNLVVEGHTYTVWVGPESEGYPITVDLNGDGDLTGVVSTFTSLGGLVLTFGTAQDLSSVDEFNMTLSASGNVFDDSTSSETLTWAVQEKSSGEVGLGTLSYTGPNTCSSDEWCTFDLINDESKDDHDRAVTDFGVSIDLYNPSGSNDAEELTLSVPYMQLGAIVSVVGETTE